MTDAPNDGARGEADPPGEADAPGEADRARETGAARAGRAADGTDAEDAADAAGVRPARQRVERTGRRRARLTPAPDTDVSPEKPSRDQPAPGGTSDDDRITRERPPHW